MEFIKMSTKERQRRRRKMKKDDFKHINPVDIIIHGDRKKTNKTGLVRPYPRAHPVGIKYSLPIYKMEVKQAKKGEKLFDVLRFGIQLFKGRKPTVQGIIQHPKHPLRRRRYMGGSWQIKKVGQQLIHNGADYPAASAWGLIGCISVVGPKEWERFEALIKNLAGENEPYIIGWSGKLNAEIHYAKKPILEDLPQVK